MLHEGKLINFLTGDDIDLGFITQVVDDECAENFLEFGDGQYVHFVAGAKEHFIADVFLFYGAESAQVLSVDVFLLSFLDGLEDLIE